MIVTNLEIVQASVDIICALFCVLTLFYLAVNKMTDRIKYLMLMYGCCIGLFIFDALAYIFRGNVTPFCYFMTKLSNNVVFGFNAILSLIFVGYLKGILEENRVRISKYVYLSAVGCFATAGAFTLINYFADVLFYLDEGNNYHRNPMWYVYAALFLIGDLILIGILLKARKRLSGRIYVTTLLYLIAPLIALLVQMIIYGFSITNIGITATLTLLIIFYLKQEEDNKKKRNQDSTKERSMVATLAMLAIMVVCMSISIISCVINIQKVVSENIRKDSNNVAQLVKADIENEFLTFLTASEMIVYDYNVCEILKETDRSNATEYEEYMSNYLGKIKDNFGYQMVFVISDKTGAYYTYDGISKYIDPVNDAHDIWYQNFKRANRVYLLDVDTDEANDGRLSVFVNRSIYDEKGNFLGVGGVGVDMSQLQKTLEKFEDEYDLEINLIDRNGLVQINSDSIEIENTYLDNSYLVEVQSGSIRYDLQTNSSRSTIYLDMLDWYLIIEDYRPNTISVIGVVVPCLGIFLVGLLIMGFVFSYLTKRERDSSEKLVEKTKISLTDDLTGLLNRRAFEEYISKIDEKQLAGNLALMMLDVNGLKMVNDELGHEAGDEMLRASAKCLLQALGKYGRVFRMGGDEFTAILEGDKDDIAYSLYELDKAVTKHKGKRINGFSISKGVVYTAEYPGKSVEEILEIADKLMYKDKSEFYERSGRDRRKG